MQEPSAKSRRLSPRPKLSPRESAFKGLLASFRLTLAEPAKNLPEFLEEDEESLTALLEKELKERRGLKAWVSVSVTYENPKDPEKEPGKQNLTPKAGVIIAATDIPDFINRCNTEILTRNANFLRESSGLILSDIHNMDINISKYNPLAAHGFQELPPFLKNKKCIVNIQNEDDRGFGYALLSALHPSSMHSYRPSHYTEDMFEQHGLHYIQ